MRVYAKPLALLLALCLSAMPLRAAEPEVLKQIPQNADVVVLIPSLAGLDSKVAKLAVTFGSQEQLLQAPLQSIKLFMNLSEGLDDNGSAAVVLSNIPLPGGAAQPDMLVLLPVSDYAKFVGNFGVTPAAGLTAVEWQGNSAFVKQAGKFAVLSNSQAVAEKFVAPSQASVLKTAGLLGSQSVLGGDVVVFADLTRLAPMVRPLVQLGAMQMKQEMTNNAPEAAAVLPMVDTMVGAVDAILRDAQSAVVSLDASDDGIGLSVSFQFRADSELAKQFAKAPATEPQFNRLPAKPYLMAWSSNTSTIPYITWMETLSKSFPKDVPGMEAMQSIMTTSIESAKAMGDEAQSVWLAPNLAAGTAGFFNMLQVYPSKDPKATLAAYKKVFEKMNNLELGQGISYQTSYADNVMQVDGLNVDQFKMRINLPADQTAALGPAAAIFGSDMGGYAVAASGAAVFATGADPVSLKEAIAAAAGKDAGLEGDKGIASVRSKLMKHRFAEMYLGVGTIVSFANQFLQLVNPEMVIDAPADLPPLAMSLSVADGGMGMRLYVPMPIITTGKKVYDKFNGGSAGSFGAASPTAEPEVEESEFVSVMTDADFADVAEKSSKPVLVDFWAVWCGPCKVQAPIVNEVAEQYKDQIVVGKLDIDENPDTADKYEIEAIPTLLILKDGKVFKKFVGVTEKAAIEAALKEALQ